MYFYYMYFKNCNFGEMLHIYWIIICLAWSILIESSIKHCTLRTSVNEVHVWKAKKPAMDYGNSGFFFTTSKLKFTDRRFASIHLIAFTRTVFSIVLRSTKYSLASYIYIMK